MQWRIKNFKGIKSAQLDIEEGKVSVITGVNSSGKSSIIQSLLLMAQSGYNEGSIVLNGPLVRLGEASDLVRENAQNNIIQISVDIDQTLNYEPVDLGPIEAVYELAPNEPAGLHPSKIELISGDDTSQPLVLSAIRSRKNDAEVALKATDALGQRHALHIKSLLKSSRRQLRTYVVVKGIQPHAIVQILEPHEIESMFIKQFELYLHDRRNSESKMSDSIHRPNRFAVGREMIALISASEETVEDSSDEFRDFLEIVRKTQVYKFDRAWDRLDKITQNKLIGAAAKARSGLPYIAVPIGYNDSWFGSARQARMSKGLLESSLILSLGESGQALSSLNETVTSLARRVQYLGPLRDEPRVVWNHWNELARGLPVGTRGEYSAAVLSRDNRNHIQYVNPDSESVNGSLATAVNEWLAYLEIGTSIASRSHGKLGLGLDLDVSGKIRDLTSVGVGVSQALPLLVGLLSTPANSIFIVEQPELHLHPAVQARLADFMLKARPDLTLIVETHSDSFVTRVRRRVAEGTCDPSKIDVMFVEPLEDGATARSLVISEYGDLSEWPKGFLSSAEEDVRAILMANITRSKENAINE